MPYTPAEKKKVITRLRRFRGQAEALEIAIEKGVECSYTLQQLAALRGAVNGMMAQVLESHVRETLGTNHPAESGINDTVTLIKTYLK